MIVAIENGGVLVVEQYRHPTGTVEIELCAGMLEKGEETLSGAARELEEETGLRAKEFHVLGVLHFSTSLSSWKVHVVAASDFTPTTATHPTEAGVRAKWMPISEWEGAIRSNKVSDALSIAAWKLYQNSN